LRQHTSVLVEDGAMTSFWHDHWIGSAPLATIMSVLLSHTTRPNMSVKAAVADGEWNLCLLPRLSLVANNELQVLLQGLQQVQLMAMTIDQRRMWTSLKLFSIANLYRAMSPMVQEDAFTTTI
ncbi:hypothetical protein BAE44_0020090, partial [Dichanthelium oligosanthes]